MFLFGQQTAAAACVTGQWSNLDTHTQATSKKRGRSHPFHPLVIGGGWMEWRMMPNSVFVTTSSGQCLLVDRGGPAKTKGMCCLQFLMLLMLHNRDVLCKMGHICRPCCRNAPLPSCTYRHSSRAQTTVQQMRMTFTHDDAHVPIIPPPPIAN